MDENVEKKERIMSKVVGNQYRNVGGAAFLILAALAITSNNQLVKVLGENWKRLHYLIYVAVVLVIIHSSGIGMIYMGSELVKSVVLLLITVVIVGKILMTVQKR